MEGKKSAACGSRNLFSRLHKDGDCRWVFLKSRKFDCSHSSVILKIGGGVGSERGFAVEKPFMGFLLGAVAHPTHWLPEHEPPLGSDTD